MANTLTLRTVRDQVLRRLGDTIETPAASRIWSETEIEDNIREGYNDLCLKTKILWDMRHVDDLPFTGNYNVAWEKAYFLAGELIFGEYSFTATGDKDFQDSTPSPANHQTLFERDFYLTQDLISAVERLPESLYQIDRVTWDGFKAFPLQSRKLMFQDNYFETIKGRVYGYLVDRDGLRNIRKWKVPGARALYYIVFGLFGILRGSAESAETPGGTIRLHIDQFGMIFGGVLDEGLSVFGAFSYQTAQADNFVSIADPLTNLSEFGQDVIAWRPGILRRLPGYFPANGPRGFVKRLSQDGTNTRVEFFRRPHRLAYLDSTFEIPDYMVKHAVRCYALWKAYNRKGPGQDLKWSAHYKARYTEATLRILARTQAIYRTKVWRMGGGGKNPVYQSKPYAALPRNF